MCEVKYKQIATTEDTNDPVVRVSIGESIMDVILDSENDAINVWMVQSREKGHMKRMLDDLVSQHDTNEVVFLHPLDEQAKEVANDVFEKFGLDEMEQRGVKEAVEGFEEMVIELSGRETHVLKGEWET